MSSDLKPELTVAFIIHHVARFYGLDPRLITSPRRHERYVRPRHLAMWLARDLMPDYSLPRIGRAFGHRDHSTVRHGIARIEAILDHDSVFHAMAIGMRREISALTVDPSAAEQPAVNQVEALLDGLSKAVNAIRRASPEIAARCFGEIRPREETDHDAPV
ncbi:MAG: hypothetical protein E6Q98_18205 [Rhodospirillaceae bacterium]|nr:MAG: hypothetical protein E6Q98_18205 [Rhodospirillaceae bacterium]